MANLTTRANVKAFLQIPAAITMHDALIDLLLEPADQLVKGYIGSAALTQTTLYEVHDVEESQHWIATRAWPIQSVTALTNDGSLVKAADYRVLADEATVELTTDGSFFTSGRAKAQITYDGGFASTDPRLSLLGLAAAALAGAMFRKLPKTGTIRERLGTYQYTLDEREYPPEATMLLSRFRSPFVRE